MTSYVENETGVTLPFDMKDIVDKIMDAVTQMENCPYETTVNLLLVDNEGIREYNRNFRDIDKETDVLFRIYRLNNQEILLVWNRTRQIASTPTVVN